MKMKKLLGILLCGALLCSMFALPAAAVIPDFDIQNGVLVDYNGSANAVTVPATVTSIGDHAFSSNKTLTSVTLPASVTSIGNSAFAFDTALTNVTYQGNITSIGNDAFEGCSALSNFTLPTGLTSLGSYAFDSCSSLTSISIPAGLTKISDWTFYGCTKLVSVTIPSNITSIEAEAFGGCSGLTSATIPASVTNISNIAFSGVASNFEIICTPGSYAEAYAAYNYINYSTKIVSAAIAKNPNKLYYKRGQNFDLTGASLNVTRQDGTTSPMAVTTSMLKSSITFTRDGKTNVNIYYTSTQYVTFVVTVDSVAPKITVKNSKNKVLKKNGKSKKWARISYSEPHLLTKVITRNGKKANWPSNGKVSKKGNYKVTLTDKSGNTGSYSFKVA